jgi:hypothetical protein
LGGDVKSDRDDERRHRRLHALSENAAARPRGGLELKALGLKRRDVETPDAVSVASARRNRLLSDG